MKLSIAEGEALSFGDRFAVDANGVENIESQKREKKKKQNPGSRDQWG